MRLLGAPWQGGQKERTRREDDKHRKAELTSSSLKISCPTLPFTIDEDAPVSDLFGDI